MSSVFRHPQATPARNYQMDMGMRMPKPPERPLQPYMRYSRKMWPKVHAENPDVPMWDVGRIIQKLWAEVSDAERAAYQHEYELEKADFEKQMKNFQNSGFMMTTKGRAKHNEKMTRTRMEAGGVVIQPVDEDDGTNELSTRRLAGVRFERNNRLISDLFSPTIVTDTRTIVSQHRLKALRHQAMNLDQHREKLQADWNVLVLKQEERKRLLEKGSEDFEENMKKVVSERPVVDEAKFEQTVSEWEGKLKTAYVEYKKKQEELKAKNEASAPLLRNLVMDDDSPKENGDKEKKKAAEEVKDSENNVEEETKEDEAEKVGEAKVEEQKEEKSEENEEKDEKMEGVEEGAEK